MVDAAAFIGAAPKSYTTTAINRCHAAQVAWPGSSIQSWIDRGTMAAVNRGFARVAGARLSGASLAKQSFVPSMLRPLRGIPFNSVIWWQGCARSRHIHMHPCGDCFTLRSVAMCGSALSWLNSISLQHVHSPGGLPQNQTALRGLPSMLSQQRQWHPERCAVVAPAGRRMRG